LFDLNNVTQFNVEKVTLNDVQLHNKEDSGATWEYSKALYLFKKYGPKSIKAAKQLNKAKKENKHVIEYLTEKKKLPKAVPSTYVQGSNEEAQIYISEGLAAWKSTPGAIEWFNEWN
jgi:hypothetical protein